MQEESLEKARMIVKNIEDKTFELFEKMEIELMDYESSGLNYETQKKVEEIYQGSFIIYNLAVDFEESTSKKN